MSKGVPFKLTTGETLMVDAIKKRYGISQVEVMREALRITGILFSQIEEDSGTDSLIVDCLNQANFAKQEVQKAVQAIDTMRETNALLRSVSGECSINLKS